MKLWLFAGAVSMVVAAAAMPQAQAKGCLKGAAVGGLAGHMAGHGVVGAAGGCAVGHHMAAKHERQARAQQTTTSTPDQPR